MNEDRKIQLKSHFISIKESEKKGLASIWSNLPLFRVVPFEKETTLMCRISEIYDRYPDSEVIWFHDSILLTSDRVIERNISFFNQEELGIWSILIRNPGFYFCVVRIPKKNLKV